MKILSVHFAHDSNIAYVNNGTVLATVNEDRFTRKKKQTGWPNLAIKWLFEKYKLNFHDFDKIIIIGDIKEKSFEEPFNSISGFYRLLQLDSPRFNKIYSIFINFLDNIFPIFKIKHFLLKKMFLNFLINKKINIKNVEFFDHHLAHAAGAFFMSNYSEAYVFTMDGKGDGASHKTYFAKYHSQSKESIFKLISKSNDYDSLGFFYSTITEYLGFRRIRHEGKVTGLAAYGDFKKMQSYEFPYNIDFSNKKINFNYIGIFDRIAPYLLYLKFLFLSPKVFFEVFFKYSCIYGRYNQEKNLKLLKKHFKNEKKEDVASYAQHHLEKTVVSLIKNTLKSTIQKKSEFNVCLSGGIFANVKLNQKINEINEVKNLFILPGMGDGGLALGAALYSYNKYAKDKNLNQINNVFLGPSFTNEDIEKELIKSNLKFENFKEGIELKIAECLFQNKVVGRFEGKMEWGPRALGNRSILANPTKIEINDELNKRLNRTKFMPFAPSILVEHVDDYLIGYDKSSFSANYMSITYDIKKNKISEIPAVVHIDNTARPQIVDSMINQSYHNIINEYYKLSGIPVIINTSFNLHEEPIVCDPKDAIKVLKQKSIDILAIGTYLVEFKN